MKTPKEKDSVLSRYYHNITIDHIASKEIIDILIADSYVENIRYADGSFNKLTDKGKGFILNGGYTEQENNKKKEENKKWRTSTINWIMALVIAAASSIITVIVTKLLS